MNETLIQTLIRILPADEYSVQGVHRFLMDAGVRSLDPDNIESRIAFHRALENNQK